MSNTPSTSATTDPAPTPAPAPADKPKRHRSAINRKHLEELKNSRAVAKAALDPASTAILAAVDFDATIPNQINALASVTEKAIGKLTGNRASKTDLTAQESAARDALIAVIVPIQTAARRQFVGDHETLRHAYFIGEGLADETLHEVQAAAIAIRDRLVAVPPATAPVDVLPGIKAPQIAALSGAITTYASGVTAPQELKNQNEGALQTIETNLAALAGLRHQAQLAAEQAFPWRTPGVTATRQAFLLPTDRPLPN
jgi:hypothetical protein